MNWNLDLWFPNKLKIIVKIKILEILLLDIF